MADDLLDTIRQGNLDDLQDSNDLIKHIVLETVYFPNEFKWAGLGKHVLDIFEEELASEVRELSTISPHTDVFPLTL